MGAKADMHVQATDRKDRTDFQKIPKESFDLLIIEIRIGLGPNGNLDQGSYSATNDKETG